MRRKYTESEIKNLEHVCHCFLALSTLISFISIFPLAYFEPPSVALIAFIWFLISFVCFVISFTQKFKEAFCIINFLHKRNEKIDEEEKAQLQAKAQAEADKEKAELQIWVNV